MHATFVRGAAGGGLHIVHHCGLPSRHAAVENIWVVQNTMASSEWDCKRRQAPERFSEQLRHRIKTD